ncbi:hypothetical protein MGYG_07681 [Nannizzia gypsea CBS 118893]|uniref:Uncharacterized protein n=1 Tax=Arthroderma gypseum (strain ATCC MYA-4604 / CBS 118893) TaxID=535722 RepID=E4V3V1_ARTGP|nr:hypothetical protein MGYG_07681 [Nannizzia gypsea CBS 118893]EFR04675.1 hypothetical protein MGYG_07681 [Nannizzia gypsea CBS 118893]
MVCWVRSLVLKKKNIHGFTPHLNGLGDPLLFTTHEIKTMVDTSREPLSNIDTNRQNASKKNARCFQMVTTSSSNGKARV